MEIVFLIIGLLLGAVAVYFISKYRSESNSSRAEERAGFLVEANSKLTADLTSEREKMFKLNSEHSSLRSDHVNMQKKLEEQKQEFEELQTRFAKEFENLANKILEEKSKKFTDQNRSNMDEILKPLNEKIKDFEKTVNDIHNQDTRERASLTEQLRSLHDLNQQMSKDASNLTKALKGDPQVQGSWGEIILETILERSGLVKDREYTVQTTFYSEEGRRHRPDVIIKLPDGKSIIVDSKVSLLAYDAYCSAEDEASKSKALAAHLASIKSHVKLLSQKNYQSVYHLQSIDFVILFMPIEPAFALAMQKENSIWNEAFEKNIIVVSPTTLLSTLRTISYIWKQDSKNKNAMEIATKSAALYEKFAAFSEKLIEVGKRMNSAKESYDDAMNKLSTGRGNLVAQVENIKRLGVTPSKSISPQLLNRASEFENTMFPEES